MQIPGDHSASLHALFPTLVYQKHLDDWAVWKSLFDAERDAFGFIPEPDSGSRHFAGEYHGRILLHQQPSLRPFFQILATEVGHYLRALGMKPAFFDMQCLKTWFVLCDPSTDEQQSMIAHNHSCSDVSWVYYLDVPEGCPIRFHATRTRETAPFQSAFHYDWHNEEKSAVDKLNWWNRDSYTLHPAAGDLLLFPGHQLHSVDSNTSSQTRVSIAGDIALTLKPEYLDLEFGRSAEEHWLKLSLSDDDAQAERDP